MSRIGLWGVTVAAVAIVAGGCSKDNRTEKSLPEQPAVGTGGAGANVKDDDDFVRDVALKNVAQIELSRIALEKAISPDIKSFAQMVVDENGAAGSKLKSAVSGNPGDWPAQLDEKHRETADELRKKQGADFEREYVEAMVEIHQDFAAKLESRLDVQSVADWKTAAAGRAQSKAMPDPRTEMRDVQVRPAASDKAMTTKINQWAAETYPVAQKRLDTARALENAAKRRSTD